jgi:hypothetical protein
MFCISVTNSMIQPEVKETQKQRETMKTTKIIESASIAPSLSVSGHFLPWQQPIG